MSEELKDFYTLVSSCEEVDEVYSYYNKMPNPMDLSDLIRWELTQAVSAMDKYIHDVVRQGMLNEEQEITPKTNSFNNIKLTISDITTLQKSDNMIDAFDKIIIRMHGYKSFQSPSNISKALSLIWSDSNKMQCIAQKMDISKSSLEDTLSLISQRRNSIVHQGDFYDVRLGNRSSIEQTWVSDSIVFIKCFCESIDACLTEEKII